MIFVLTVSTLCCRLRREVRSAVQQVVEAEDVPQDLPDMLRQMRLRPLRHVGGDPVGVPVLCQHEDPWEPSQVPLNSNPFR